MNKTLIPLALAAGLAGFTSHADVVIEVDIISPSEVILTATGGLSDETVADCGLGRLEDFFTKSTGFTASSPSGNLTFGGEPLTASTSFRNASDGVSLDTAPTVDPSVTDGVAPFTGSETINFSGVASSLPSAGTTGNFETYNNTIIGTWEVEVIPEPVNAALAGFGLVLVCGRTGRLYLHNRHSTMAS